MHLLIIIANGQQCPTLRAQQTSRKAGIRFSPGPQRVKGYTSGKFSGIVRLKANLSDLFPIKLHKEGGLTLIY